MQNQPSTFRFSLRALFVVVAFVGVGLLALKYPIGGLRLMNLLVVVMVVYSSISALVGARNRRPSRIAFSITVIASLLVCQTSMYGLTGLVPQAWINSLVLALHPTAVQGNGISAQYVGFHCSQIVHLLIIIAVAAITAYTIPWLVQQGQKPPQA